jgi:signal transduction histidine kinase
MTEKNKLPFLTSLIRGARHHFGLGVTLMAILPVLTFLYLKSTGFWEHKTTMTGWHFLIYVILVASGISGYMLLKKYPSTVTRLRHMLDNVIRTQFPDQKKMLESEDDLDAIEKSVQFVVNHLKNNGTLSDEDILDRKDFRQKTFESLSVMSTGVAHDFNNLLAAILGNTSIVLRSLPEDLPARNHAQQIETTSLRAVELTNQVMACSGKGRFIVEKVDISELIRKMEDRLKSSVSKHVTLEYHLNNELPTVTCDPAQVRQVILDLVTNASEATFDKDGTVTITTGSMNCDREYLKNSYMDDDLPEGDYVYVDVADTGCGITREIQRRMFEPFFTAKLRARGMGLSVVIGIIRAHGGAVRVESTPGKGTTFRILLPCKGPSCLEF